MAKEYFANEVQESVIALEHPNIVKVIAYSQEEFQWKKTKKTYTAKFIAFELAAGGEFFDYLLREGKHYDEKTCRYYFK